MNKRKIITKKIIEENLIDHFPLEHRIHVSSKDYVALCDALYDYMKSDYDSKDEKKETFLQAKKIFQSLFHSGGKSKNGNRSTPT